MRQMNVISVLIEVIVVFLGLLMAFSKKKSYGFFLALTFAIYVFYDFSRFFSINIDKNLNSIIFLIASLSILWAAWRIYRE